MSEQHPDFADTGAGVVPITPVEELSPFEFVLPEECEVKPDRLCFTISCHEEMAYIRRYRADGAFTAARPIDFGDLIAILAPEVDIDTDLLPPDALFYVRRGRAEFDAVWVAPRRWDVLVRDRLERPPRAYRLPMPGLVFVCGRGSGFLAVYAAAERPRPGPRGDATQLYHCPAFNVHDNGTVCKGYHHFSDDPARVAGDFFGSYFATEITGRGRSRRHPDDLEALWREIDGQEEYPLPDLVPHMTVGELRRWLKGTR